MKASILAIGGISRSGKSTLAHQLAKELASLALDAMVISQDDYCLPAVLLPKIKGVPDWEVPASMDWDRYHEAVFQAKQTHDWIIVEGLFVFDDHQLNTQYDHQIVLEISYEVFMKRRNVEQRWGIEPAWYIQYVWDAYQLRNPHPKTSWKFSGADTIDVRHILHKLDI